MFSAGFSSGDLGGRNSGVMLSGNSNSVVVCQPARSMRRTACEPSATLDLAGRHAAGIHRDHLVVEPRQAPAVLLDKLWIESTLPIPGNRQLHPAIVGEHPLTTMAVAVVAAELLVFVVEMLIQLGIEDAFRQCLLQILDPDRRFEMPQARPIRPIVDPVARLEPPVCACSPYCPPLDILERFRG